MGARWIRCWCTDRREARACGYSTATGQKGDMQRIRDARPCRVVIIAGLASATFCGACAFPASAATSPPFYMGGDISMLPFLEGRGANYRDAGQVRPAEQIMVNHGANLFRLRLF